MEQEVQRSPITRHLHSARRRLWFGRGIARAFGLRRVAIDFGSAWTRIAVEGRSQVLAVPSAVAVQDSLRVRAVGHKALAMRGRAPAGVRVIEPIRAGAIVSFGVAEAMLTAQLARALPGPCARRSQCAILAPSLVSPIHARALEQVAVASGTRTPQLVPISLATAIGAGLPVGDARGHLVLNVGAGLTEVGVVSLGGVVVSRVNRTAGRALDRAIASYLRRECGLLVGEESVEQLKIELATASREELTGPIKATVRGREVLHGLPTSIEVSAQELLPVVRDVASEIADAVHWVLERTPPELVSDIADNGIHVAGGGSLLRGLSVVLTERTGLTVRRVQSPFDCAVRGCLAALLRNDKSPWAS